MAAAIGISDLPPEIMWMIFNHLDVASTQQASQVCSKWKEDLYQPIFWHPTKTIVALKKHWPNPSVFPSLAERGINRLHGYYLNCAAPEVDHLVCYLNHLVELKLCCPTIDDANVSKIFSKECPKLQQLIIMGPKLNFYQCISDIVPNCPNLTSLDLGISERFTDEGLLLILTGLCKLQSLSLFGGFGVNAGTLGHFEGNFQGIDHSEVAKNATLKSLSLNNFLLTGDTFEFLAKMVALQKLSLSLCASIETSEMDSFINNGSKISELIVESNSTLSKTVCMTQVGRMPNIRKLTLSTHYITKKDLQKLASGDSGIEELNIISTFGLKVKRIEHLSQLKKLRKLTLESFNWQLNSLTDMHQAVLLNHEVDINYYNGKDFLHITDDGLKHLAGLTSLQHLHLRGGSEITCIGLYHLAHLHQSAKLNHLARLNRSAKLNLEIISYSQDLEPVVSAFMKHFPQLQDSLKVKVCSVPPRRFITPCTRNNMIIDCKWSRLVHEP